MRKRMAFVLFGCAMLWALCARAQAQIGFAEVNNTRVNVRSAPGGKLLFRVDAPQSVFVFEEKEQDGTLWCHVTTYHGKNTVSAWIRGDMLRFVGEEFEGVVSVQAGQHYVTGLRADGTVAIMGDDMPHSPCVETVRGWCGMVQVSSWICEVYGIDNSGTLHAAGRGAWLDGSPMVRMDGKIPFPIADDGTLDMSVYAQILEDVLIPAWLAPHQHERVRRVVGVEYDVLAVLTEEGRIYTDGRLVSGGSGAMSATGYQDMDLYWDFLLALRDDGRVAIMPGTHPLAQAVSGWQQITKVAAGECHALGLCADGTVRYAGDDAAHAAQVGAWKNVVDIAAGPDYSIALKADGTVIMAGKYDQYER